ncbi:uncharacterized protein LOC111240813 [Vigna radiata var. radiata]|uniref:Uncharacterized protein LOC111240813 n=1 Tax=Vigna radiata var. radiata TaxID=3916 RepID=A0A3Q0EPH6_VIGRR|nr:uncharacterized protein LOC111240813 [Vigna radiata var. radiata]
MQIWVAGQCGLAIGKGNLQEKSNNDKRGEQPKQTRGFIFGKLDLHRGKRKQRRGSRVFEKKRSKKAETSLEITFDHHLCLRLQSPTVAVATFDLQEHKKSFKSTIVGSKKNKQNINSPRCSSNRLWDVHFVSFQPQTNLQGFCALELDFVSSGMCKKPVTERAMKNGAN